MWELHRLLDLKEHKTYVVEEISTMLQNIPPFKIKTALRILYDTVSIKNPLEVAILFTKGLQKNKFFHFQSFIETLHGSSK